MMVSQIPWLSDDSRVTVPVAVQKVAARQPDAVFLYDRAGEGQKTHTFGDIASEMNRCAAVLAAHGLQPGEKVAMLIPNGSFFLTSFLGIQRAGAVAVPLYASLNLNTQHNHFAQLVDLFGNAAVRGLIVGRKLTESSQYKQVFDLPSLRFVLSEDDFRGDPGPPPDLKTDNDDLALIQYTSGTTATQRGVMVRHRNILDQVQAMEVAWKKASVDDCVVLWLPMTHDMGLVAAASPLIHGVPLVLMSPETFLFKPLSWLHTISEFRGTITVAPNFGYQRCVNFYASKAKPEALEGLDLSSLRIALSGAEQVIPSTVEKFCECFAPHGFRRESMYPGYGMAETTLAVTWKPLEEPVRYDEVDYLHLAEHGRAVPAEESAPGVKSVTLVSVSVGKPVPGMEVRIVDEAGETLPERSAGEVLARGRSVTAGYFDQEELTAKTFRDGWFYTGDLGYLSDGHLYITGRKKDLIIQRGRKYHPQTLEQVVTEMPELGSAAAFGVTDEGTGTERIVLVVESRTKVDGDRRMIQEECRRRIAERLGVTVDEVALVPRKFIPKSTSGKVRRSATQHLYLTQLRNGGGQ
jgi:acyl-CoA synthetase (AMP-forming)/AMP-acid ligase II